MHLRHLSRAGRFTVARSMRRRLSSPAAVVPMSDFQVPGESAVAPSAIPTSSVLGPEALPPIDITALTPVPLTNWPSDLALRGVELMHDALGIPWWAAIIGCTLCVRAALLPLALKAARQQAVMQGLKDQLIPLQTRLQTSGGADLDAANEINAIYERHGVSPLRLIAVPLAQAPIFMSFFMGLRRLADAFPAAHTDGALWFVDLGARDD